MNLRRIVSVIALFAAIFSVVEPVLGELRDDTVHQADAVVAVPHDTEASSAVAEHAPIPGHSHSGSHQHGTGADHCAHQHGVGFPGHTDVFLPAVVTVSTSLESLIFSSRTSTQSFHPPRA